jgi:glycosyltransferase involved in cell wall biosynthesis
LPRRVLLTVSGVIDPDVWNQVQRGVRPQPDYLELANAMGADVLDVAEARRRAGRWAKLVERIGGPAVLLAFVCFRERQRYDAIFTDGEQVGLPLALFCRLTFSRPASHVMVAHLISVPKKVLLYRLFRLGRYIEQILVYSSAQRRYIIEKLGFPVRRVALTTFMVDAGFFSPDCVDARPDMMICSAGLEFRDYTTLIEAVRDLDVRVVIAAASNWSKRANTTDRTKLPANVELRRLDYLELRQLYADARFVVMPLRDVNFQAGVTTILEAMAMSKAVICSRTTGQTDVLVDDHTGIYVPPGDAASLREAIVRLIATPDEADRLGANARRYAERECDVSVYAQRLTDVVIRAIEYRRVT